MSDEEYVVVRRVDQYGYVRVNGTYYPVPGARHSEKVEIRCAQGVPIDLQPVEVVPDKR